MCPCYVNCTKEECIKVIKNIFPEFICCMRYELRWFKNIAYTLDNKNDIFQLFR